MYTSLRIRNFRCHEDLAFEDLAPINLIVGRNNAGKSAVLEALFIFSGGCNPHLAVTADARRGIDRIEFSAEAPPWASLFRDYDTSRLIKLAAGASTGLQHTLTMRDIRNPLELARLPIPSAKTEPNGGDQKSVSSAELQPTLGVLELGASREEHEYTAYAILRPDGVRVEPPAPLQPPTRGYFLTPHGGPYIDEDARLFTSLEVSDHVPDLVSALRVLEPALEGLSLLVLADRVLIHGRIPGERPMPLPILGQGMQRVAQLLLRILNAPGGMVLADEIETGLHHSVLKDVWRAVRDAAVSADVQLFATTHSAECVAAAGAAFADAPSLFRLHRIDRIGGRTSAVTYDTETLLAADEMKLEVR